MTVDTFPFHSNYAGDDDFRKLTSKPNEAFCSLESTDVERTKGIAEDQEVSSGCDLEYASGQSADEMVPAARATTSPPTQANTFCGASCIRTFSGKLFAFLLVDVIDSLSNLGKRFGNMTVFRNGDEIGTFEDCPFCSLKTWNATLPVPDDLDVLPLCNITMDKQNFWHFQNIGEQYLDCEVHCSCDTNQDQQ